MTSSGKCVQCGAGFARTASSGRVYSCSQQCRLEYLKKTCREQRHCLQCGVGIWSYKAQSGVVKSERKYCSKSCMDEYRRAQRPSYKCKTCGCVFQRPKSSTQTKYCSRACYGREKTNLIRQCLECSKDFRYLRKDDATAKYCSFQCKVRFEGRRRRRVTPHVAHRCSVQSWRELRKRIIERDGFACSRCGNDFDLVVHHIVPFRDGGSNDPQNLITLCRRCHMPVEYSARPVPLKLRKFTNG